MNFNKENFGNNFQHWLQRHGATRPENATSQQVLDSIAHSIMDHLLPFWNTSRARIESSLTKRACYFSAEFLLGRALGNNLINLSIYDDVANTLRKFGVNLNTIEEIEKDPALGNGGLGRLAACLMESSATLRLPIIGYGIRYRYGMFRQEIVDNRQCESPDNWRASRDPWSIRREDRIRIVRFGGQVHGQYQPDGSIKFRYENTENILAVPLDMPIIGWDNNYINTLRLWEAESPTPFNLEQFSQSHYIKSVEPRIRARNISRVLYPNDSTDDGKALRLRQQYFFCSASIQDIIAEFKSIPGASLHKLHESYAIQLNDTHPVIAIPELMRILMDEEGMGWEKAMKITEKVFAYTNHTVMSEALEHWPVDLWRREVPRLLQIVEQINHRLIRKHPQISIIEHRQIKMASLACRVAFSINGVAALHSQLIKEKVLQEWHQVSPRKFNNKTNGVTQRRWLRKANPLLSTLLDETIGPQWTANLALLTQLHQESANPALLDKISQIKQKNKERLAKLVQQTNGVSLNTASIFDIQIKRQHEYKRQLMNILSIIADWQALGDGEKIHAQPRSIIFAAKAASSYRRARQVIQLINVLSRKINTDPAAAGHLQVAFVPNYRVSLAEIMFPAAEISQQISLAGTEASGTGNMKFMMNGAITLGTLDGANIEIVKEVGPENAFIFGLKADEVFQSRAEGQYSPMNYLKENPRLERALETLVDGTLNLGDEFQELYDSLLHGVDGNPADQYLVLKDFNAYHEARRQISEAYSDRERWNRMSLLNIASSGIFSSDRTIWEYATDIWEISPMKKQQAP